MEKIRQPKNFQDRVIEAFLSEENTEYLYNLIYYNLIKLKFIPPYCIYLLQSLIPDMITFSSSSGDIYNILDSDNIAMRAKLQYGINVWDEVKRLNIVFYQSRIDNYLNNAYGQILPPSQNENLPLSPLSQNSQIWTQPQQSRQQSLQPSHPSQPPQPPRPSQPPQTLLRPPLKKQKYSNYDKLLDHVPVDGAVEDNEDYAMKMFISDSLQPEGYEYLNNMGPKYELLENQHNWTSKDGKKKYDMGDANGNPFVTGTEDEDGMDFETSLAIAMADPIKYMNKKANIVGSDNGAFMRYKEIPFWQNLSREGTDTDIDETLGFGAKETRNHVRGWDMQSLREKNGKSYTRYYGAMNNSKI